MFVIIIQLLSWLAFTISSFILGARLWKNPSKKGTERTSLILHFLFWAGVAPFIEFGFLYPGLPHFDTELEPNPLPSSSTLQLFGVAGLLIGISFILASNNRPAESVGNCQDLLVLPASCMPPNDGGGESFTRQIW